MSMYEGIVYLPNQFQSIAFAKAFTDFIFNLVGNGSDYSNRVKVLFEIAGM